MQCKIVAEIGWNHMGDISLAKKMIDAAHLSGVDCIKFQTWSVEDLQPGTWDEDGRKEIYKKAELTRDKHKKLFDYCVEKNIQFLTSVFNVRHIAMLRALGCNQIKIASCESLNFDLLSACFEAFGRVYISTGGLTSLECLSLLDFIKPHSDKTTLLHCVSLYPCADEKSNIERMHMLKSLSGCEVGYSDHTAGCFIPYMAIAKGAAVIEKHFTIDNDLPGRDNKNACLPDVLKQICDFRDLHETLVENTTLERNTEEVAFEEFRGRWTQKK